MTGDELRALVREVLAEALGGVRPGVPGGVRPAVPAGEQVRITGDAELTAFAVRIARLCDDPAARQALLAGELRFRLAFGPGPAPAAGIGPAGTATGAGTGPGVAPIRAGRGPVTERQVRAAAAAGARLVLGPGAVLTPLARDRARQDRVEIVDERKER